MQESPLHPARPASSASSGRGTAAALPAGGFRAKTTWGLLVSLAFLGQSLAATLPPIELAWNKNPERNIAGYELRYGTTPGEYPEKINAGKDTRVTVKGLKEGVTYYFVVVARNKAGRTSPKSEVVTYRRNAPAPPPPTGRIITPANDLTITTGDSVDFTAKASDPNDKTPLTYRWDFGEGSGIPDARSQDPGSRTFHQPGTYKVTFTVTNARGKDDPTPATRIITVMDPVYTVIPRSGWKLKYVDSQEAVGYAATSAFDGNPGTFWHTKFTNVALTKKPHEIQIDMGSNRLVSGFQYLPRQDGFNIGNVARYKFYVSKDGKKWGKPVATGTFQNTTVQKQVHFKSKQGRYVRLQSLTEANGNTDTNVAELEVLQIQKNKVKKKSSPVAKGAKSSPSFAATALAGLHSPAPLAPPLATTEVIDGRKYLALTVTRSSAVKPVIEVSSDLLTWFSGPSHTTVLIDNDRLLKVRDNTPLTADRKRHIRVKPQPR